MTRDDFEQLTCEWLDEPGSAELRSRLDAAIRADTGLEAVLAEWTAFDATLRANMPTPRGVDWARLRVGISSAVDVARDEDVRLDAALQASDPLAGRVDWLRLTGRISAAIDAETAGVHRARRRTLRIAGVAATFLTAAAAVLFALLPHTTTPTPVANVAVVQVVLAAPTSAAHVTGTAVARISAPPSASTPESLLIIDPPAPQSSSDSANDYF